MNTNLKWEYFALSFFLFFFYKVVNKSNTVNVYLNASLLVSGDNKFLTGEN